MAVLVSAAQQSESAICVHISPPSQASLPPVPASSHSSRSSEQGVELFVLYSSFLLAIYFTHGGVYITNPNLSICPILTSPLLSTCLCLCLCPANKFICTIYLDSTYMCVYIQTQTMEYLKC